MGKQIILTGVSFPDTLPVLTVRPPQAGLVFGIDPDSLTLDDGAQVASIADVTGIHPPATQATGTKRPTLVHNALGTGRNGIAFDGVDDSLALSGSALDLATNKTALSVFALVQRNGSTAAVRDIFSLSSGTGGVRAALGAGSGAASQFRAGSRRLDADASTFTTQTNAGFSDAPLKLGAHYEWGNAALRLYAETAAVEQHGSVVLGTAGSTSSTSSSAGSIGSTGATQYFAGTMLSLLVYEAAYSDDLKAAVHAFWLARYGL